MPTPPVATRSSLPKISIASPCSMSWEQMEGDAKKRYCGACRLHVHNFEAMTPEEIAELLTADSDRICARIFQRKDGTILSQDCPVGLVAKAKAKARRMRIAAFGFVAMLGAGAVGVFGYRAGECTVGATQTIGQLAAPTAPETVAPAPPHVEEAPLMGDIVIEPPPPKVAEEPRPAPRMGRMVVRRR